MDYNTEEIALHRINLEDHFFRITTRADKPSLVESIAQIGLLVPPALWSQPTGLRIISGFRRIQACQQLGLERLTVRQVSGDTPPLACARVAIIENASQRSLNLIETARAACLLSKQIPDPREMTAELSALGLPISRKLLVKLERLSRLSAELQAALMAGTMSLAVALETGTMAPPDQRAVRTLFATLPMSVSKQKEILSLLKDIAGRDRQTMVDVLRSEPLQAILKDDHSDRNQKIASIRRHLRRVRYPNLFQAEVQYQAALDRLKLGPHMRIDPPPGFEGQIFTLSLRFRGRADLEAAYHRLGAALKNPAIDSLFPH